ncbi:uncharacterized protein [Arachis hypogaea]|uniref:uncharacterized protein isoform X2 n=1 Tax=Arachis hypogaea TaxID=3818 RepID=UPI000DED304D
MLVPHPRNSRVYIAPFFFFFIFHTFFTGSILCAEVSLSSIEIFKTHEWLKVTPTVYFLCKGENKTVFPDVKKAHVFYDFNGQESWQPLTNFSSKKCKRCGFYEEDSIKSDDVFDEWEFCPSDFTASNAEYIRFKEKEFNATFLCSECLSIPGVGVVIAYKFWQKKRREQDQARFLKLFEDGDDIEDELGLGTVI